MFVLHSPSLQFRPGRGGLTYEGCLVANPGDRIAVVGRSGSGKTSLIKGIAGVRTVTLRCQGNGTPHLFRLNAAIKCGYLTQEPVILEHLTPMENLLLPVRWDPRFSTDRAVAEARSLALEDVLGREDIRLSGGECQRIALARLLGGAPDLMLLDEPTTGLDGVLRRDLLKRLTVYCEQNRQATLLMVTHHYLEVSEFFTHVWHVGSAVSAQDGGQLSCYTRRDAEAADGELSSLLC